MLFFLSFSHDFSECLSFESPITAIDCWGETLPDIYSSCQSMFMACLLNCKGNTSQKYCATDCLSIGNPSVEAQQCIMNCNLITDQQHNIQCLDSCRTIKRTDQNNDFSTSYDICMSFYKFYYQYVIDNEHISKSNLQNSLEKMCTSQINSLPLCEGIGITGFNTTYYSLIQSLDEYQFCNSLGFTYS